MYCWESPINGEISPMSYMPYLYNSLPYTQKLFINTNFRSCFLHPNFWSEAIWACYLWRNRGKKAKKWCLTTFLIVKSDKYWWCDPVVTENLWCLYTAYCWKFSMQCNSYVCYQTCKTTKFWWVLAQIDDLHRTKDYRRRVITREIIWNFNKSY